MDEIEGRKLRILVAGLLLLIVFGGVVDLILDDPASWRSAHVLFELALIGLSLGFALWLWRGWTRTGRSLEERRRERDAWRESARSALDGLAEAIDRQFESWELTPTEAEVALFLLKGYSHKEIAALTSRSERTVRQHAVSVYRKAGLSGRAELAAFFLEDLMLPERSREIGRSGEAPGAGADPRG